MLRPGPLERRIAILSPHRVQQRAHVVEHRQHFHIGYVQQHVEVADRGQELARPELGHVLGEGVEVLDVAIDVTVLHGEELLAGVRVERVLRCQGSCGWDVDQ